MKLRSTFATAPRRGWRSRSSSIRRSPDAAPPRRRAGAEQGRHRLDADLDHPRPADVVPGLALFYGGLVRTKNMLSVLTQVFAIACIVGSSGSSTAIAWPSPTAAASTTTSAASPRPSSRGRPTSIAATFSNGVFIPEYVYICFQMTFAMITPALIVGAFAERMKFSALCVHASCG